MGAAWTQIEVPDLMVASEVCFDNNAGFSIEFGGCRLNLETLDSAQKRCFSLRERCHDVVEGRHAMIEVKMLGVIENDDTSFRRTFVYSDFGDKITIRTDRSVWDGRAIVSKREPLYLHGHDSCINGKCYVAVDERLNFPIAKASCNAIGGELASIHSGQENARVRQVLNRSRLKNDLEVWIGLVRPNDQTSNYEFWTDGTPLEYVNWAPNEPNKAAVGFAHPPSTRYENTVAMLKDGKWNDLLGDRVNRRFVCEFDLDKVHELAPLN